MSIRLSPLQAVAAALALASAASSFAGEAGPRRRVATPDDTAAARVIVKYRAGSTLMQAQSASVAVKPLHAATMSARVGLALKDRWVLGERTQSISAQGVTAAELARRLAAQPEVEWAEPVRRKVATATLPGDPYYADGQTTITPTVGQWYLRAPTSTFVSAINAVGAWSITTGSSAVTVAVLDTGVRFDHPDFLRSSGNSQLYKGYDFIADVDTAADGGGRDADATDPGDYSTASDSCGAGPSSWHGTQTASIVGAASDNGVGMASVGRGVRVLPVRVLGKCGGWDDDIQAGMLWAGGLSSDPVSNSHPAQVINMSLGGSGSCSSSYKDVISRLNAAGVTVVVSAGNEGGAVGTPANCSGAIAVGGLRHAGTKVGYSDLGPQIAISAPAGNCVNETGACLYPILTATNSGATTAIASTYTDSFDYAVGTSFASPQVAGAAALMLSIDPTLTPARIRSVLQSTARAFPTTGGSSGTATCRSGAAVDECYCTTSTCGAGMLDVSAAVAAVAAVSPPTVSISASSLTPTPGDSVTLTASATAYGGRSIAGYAWSVTEGGTLAALSGSTIGSSATVATSAAGNVTVQVVVTDTDGGSTTQSVTLTVGAVGSGSGSDSGGSGGGGFAPAWLALLALAAAISGRARRAPRSPVA